MVDQRLHRIFDERLVCLARTDEVDRKHAEALRHGRRGIGPTAAPAGTRSAAVDHDEWLAVTHGDIMRANSIYRLAQGTDGGDNDPTGFECARRHGVSLLFFATISG